MNADNPADAVGDSLRRPEYEDASKIVAVSMFLYFILFWAIAGLGGFFTAIMAIIGLVAFPLIAWYVPSYIFEGLLFRSFFVKRRHEALLKRFHITTPGLEYLLVKPRFPKTVTKRFLQTLSVFLLFASTVAYVLPSSGPRNPFTEEMPFLSAGFVALLTVMPFVVLLWVFEDSGVRRHDTDNETIGKVGTLFEQFLFGSGTVSAFLRFVVSLSGPPAEVAGWAIAVFVIFPPVCLALTVIFHREGQLRLVKRILVVASKSGFRERTVKIE